MPSGEQYILIFPRGVVTVSRKEWQVREDFLSAKCSLNKRKDKRYTGNRICTPEKKEGIIGNKRKEGIISGNITMSQKTISTTGSIRSKGIKEKYGNTWRSRRSRWRSRRSSWRSRRSR